MGERAVAPSEGAIKLKVELILASILLSVPWGAVAQQQVGRPALAQPVAGDNEIDCSQSRFVALPDARCLSTAILTGPSGLGQFQVWRLLGKTEYLHVRLLEALFYRSNIPAGEVGTVAHIKSIDARARAGTATTEPAHYNGADYYLFKASSGEECAGFRRLGPIRAGGGYAWIIGAVTCEPKGQKLSQDQVRTFIDSVRLK